MEIQETQKGIEVQTPFYRLLLDRSGGFAIREVEITGTGRLETSYQVFLSGSTELRT